MDDLGYERKALDESGARLGCGFDFQAGVEDVFIDGDFEFFHGFPLPSKAFLGFMKTGWSGG
jgi:hypothetical protein